MTPKEKAEDLLSKYYFQVQTLDKQKQCALIAVNEILDVIVTIYDYDFEKLNPYWEEVKQEIEKL
jgi:hypothetical protein